VLRPWLRLHLVLVGRWRRLRAIREIEAGAAARRLPIILRSCAPSVILAARVVVEHKGGATARRLAVLGSWSNLVVKAPQPIGMPAVGVTVSHAATHRIIEDEGGASARRLHAVCRRGLLLAQARLGHSACIGPVGKDEGAAAARWLGHARAIRLVITHDGSSAAGR